MSHRFVVVIAVVVGAAVAALAAQAGPPGTWTRVTDKAGRNIDQVGLARTGDGVLHVFWQRRNAPTAASVRHTAITAKGKAGRSSQVLPPLRAVGDPDAVVLPDGRLRVFFPGLGSTNQEAGVMAATGSAAGSGWVREGPRVSFIATSLGSVGAGVAKSGESVFAYTRSFITAFHVGIDPGDADREVQQDKQCCDYQADLATDAKAGSTWIAYYSNANGRVGTWVQRVLPSVGKPLRVPGSVAKGKAVGVDNRVAITGRIGAPGVVVAVCQGYPVCTRALLWRVGGKALTVGTSSDVEDLVATAAPDGRVWVAWQDGRTKKLHAARSNRAATRFGPLLTVEPPRGTTSMWKLAADGALGPLDLLVSASTPGSLATWHSQVLPPLAISVKQGTPAATISVADAGDPVAGAKVVVAGKALTTSAAGVVKAALPSVTTTITATKPGYAPVSISVAG